MSADQFWLQTPYRCQRTSAHWSDDWTHQSHSRKTQACPELSNKSSQHLAPGEVCPWWPVCTPYLCLCPVCEWMLIGRPICLILVLHSWHLGLSPRLSMAAAVWMGWWTCCGGSYQPDWCLCSTPCLGGSPSLLGWIVVWSWILLSKPVWFDVGRRRNVSAWLGDIKQLFKLLI